MGHGLNSAKRFDLSCKDAKNKDDCW